MYDTLRIWSKPNLLVVQMLPVLGCHRTLSTNARRRTSMPFAYSMVASVAPPSQEHAKHGEPVLTSGEVDVWIRERRSISLQS